MFTSELEKKKQSGRSLSETALAGYIGVIVLLALAVSGGWLYYSICNFEDDIDLFAKTNLQNQKDAIRHQVDRAFEYIEYCHGQIRTELGKHLAIRSDKAERVVCLAAEGATSRRHTLERLGKVVSDDKIGELGEILLLDRDGTVLISSRKNRTEDMLRDIDRKALAKRIGESPDHHGEEPYTIEAELPPTQEIEARTLMAHCRWLPQLDVTLAAAAVFDRQHMFAQRDVLERIRHMRFGQHGYIFIFHENGRILSHPDPDWNNTFQPVLDVNGFNISGEIIRLGMSEREGFIRYFWPKPGSTVAVEKLTYIRRYEPHNWIVCAGVYLEDLSQQVAMRRETFRRRLYDQFAEFAVIFLLGLVGACLVARYFSRRLHRELSTFVDVFRHSVDSNEPIRTNQLRYREFRALAETAGQLLESRNQIEAELRDARERLQERVEQRTQELQDSERRYQVLFDCSPEAVVVLETASGLITEVNEAAVQMFGWTREELVGHHCLDFAQSFRQGNIQEMIRKRVAEGTKDFRDIVLHRKDGSPILTETSDQIFSAGDRRYICVVIRDMTERKELESQLIRSERMAAVGTLAGGVAHEFNNINASVLGFSQLALEHESLSDPEVRDYIEHVVKAALRARNVTNNLLTFSGQTLGEAQPGNIIDCVRDSLAMVQRDYEKAGIRLVCDFQPVSPLSMDSAQIGQVVLNLLLNAQHSMLGHEEKQVSISTGEDDEHIFIRVADTGCGIAPEKLNKIFSPFFSTKGEYAEHGSVQSDVRGTGLGLSVSHTIIQRHGGEIRVESKVGEGTTFTILLPKSNNPDVIELPPLKPTMPAHTPCPGGKVLIVDDELAARRLLDALLTKEGHDVTTTDDARQALDLAGETEFDIIITDLLMPQLGGIEFLKQLRARYPDRAPIRLVLTGQKSKADNAELASLDVFRIIHKPFSIQDVITAVAEAMKSRLA